MIRTHDTPGLRRQPRGLQGPQRVRPARRRARAPVLIDRHRRPLHRPRPHPAAPPSTSSAGTSTARSSTTSSTRTPRTTRPSRRSSSRSIWPTSWRQGTLGNKSGRGFFMKRRQAQASPSTPGTEALHPRSTRSAVPDLSVHRRGRRAPPRRPLRSRHGRVHGCRQGDRGRPRPQGHRRLHQPTRSTRVGEVHRRHHSASTSSWARASTGPRRASSSTRSVSTRPVKMLDDGGRRPCPRTSLRPRPSTKFFNHPADQRRQASSSPVELNLPRKRRRTMSQQMSTSWAGIRPTSPETGRKEKQALRSDDPRESVAGRPQALTQRRPRRRSRAAHVGNFAASLYSEAGPYRRVPRRGRPGLQRPPHGPSRGCLRLGQHRAPRGLAPRSKPAATTYNRGLSASSR